MSCVPFTIANTTVDCTNLVFVPEGVVGIFIAEMVVRISPCSITLRSYLWPILHVFASPTHPECLNHLCIYRRYLILV